MSTYEELLEESRFKIQSFLDSTANEYVPKMFWALHDEDPELVPEDVKDRIEKDCLGIWSKPNVESAAPIHFDYEALTIEHYFLLPELQKYMQGLYKSGKPRKVLFNLRIEKKTGKVLEAHLGRIGETKEKNLFEV